MEFSILCSKRFFPLVFLMTSFLFWGTVVSCKQNSSANSVSRQGEETGKKQDSVYIVDVTAADYAFGMPSKIPSGWVTFRMKNMGQEEHLGIVSRFPDSVSFDQLAGMLSEALETGEFEDFLPLLQLREGYYGGPAMVSPGLTGETTFHLEPGSYALTCWVKAPDGQIHLQKGMSRPFIVSDEPTGADEPRGTIDVTLSNFDIRIEDSISSGEQIFNVHFEALHNLHLARLEKGQGLEDLKEWMKDLIAPAPFKFIGGTEPALPGLETYFEATLEPGRYAFATYGYAHLGMVKEFTVPEHGKALPESSENKVVIELGSENKVNPEIPAERTAFTITNPLPEAFAYHFIALEERVSVEDVQSFYKEVHVDSIRDSFEQAPFKIILRERIDSGDDSRFILDVEDQNYLLFGPIPLEGPWEPILNNKDLFVPLKGV